MISKMFARALALAVLWSVFLSGSITALDRENTFSDSDKFSVWEVVGPDGGDVRVVAIDPRDKNRLYISTLDGQVHTSGDGGKNWTLLVNLNEPRLVLDQLLVDLRDSKIIYTSGHRGKEAGGFFRSVDGGVTWKQSKDLKNEAIHSMAQSLKEPDVLTVGTLSGVWISKNSGEDWEKISSPTMPVNVNSMALDPRTPSTMYAGTWWRAYKSTDSGKSWRLIKNGMIDDSDVFAINIDPRNADHIIASACSGIYESVNGGEKWAKIQGIPAQSRRTRDILQHPSVPGSVYAATTEGFWMSTNGGKSWMLTTSRDLEINSIAIHPEEPNRVFIGTNNSGVMVSNDGGRNWTSSNQNFTSRFTYSIIPDTKQANRVYAMTHNTATSGGYFFISDDSGRTWRQSRGLDERRISPIAVLQDRTDPNIILLGTNVGIFRSTDRGNYWTLLAPPKPKPVKKAPTRKSRATAKTKTVVKAIAPLPPAAEAAPQPVVAFTEKVKVLAFSEDGTNSMLAGTERGLFHTSDLAKGWEKIPFGGEINESVSAIHISPNKPDTIWVGTSTSGVIVSRDGGKTWNKTGATPDQVPVSSIMTDPKRPDHVYVGTIQSFYLSRDGGKTWTRRGGNLPLGNYTSILINPNNTDEIFISSSLESDGGVFYSENGGMKWKRVDSKDMKLPSRRVWTMAFDPHNSGLIYAGSHSSGVYRIERKAVSAASVAPAPVKTADSIN